MKKSIGRYSSYLRPVTYAFDLLVINLLVNMILPSDYHIYYFHGFVSLIWIICALNFHFYDVYRFTRGIIVFEKLLSRSYSSAAVVHMAPFCFQHSAWVSVYLPLPPTAKPSISMLQPVSKCQGKRLLLRLNGKPDTLL